jgi:type IV pilus assembly protein PilO
MAKSPSKKSLDLGASIASLGSQFSNLDFKDPSLWPAAPKFLLCLLITAAVTAGLWFALLVDYKTELETEQSKEVALRDDYQKKLIKAVSLEALKKQREQVQLFVIQLEKQLPSKSEMAALLSDVNQAGLGRSLQFELFKPGPVVMTEYYAEQPIALKVSGKYHDIGAFASDVAHLSRIVTLNNISISPAGKDSTGLVMEATAKTFRYLDPDEIESQKQAQQKNAPKNRAGGAK